MNQFDIQLYSIAEQLDHIEKKIDNRLNKTWMTTQDVKSEYGFYYLQFREPNKVDSYRFLKELARICSKENGWNDG